MDLPSLRQISITRIVEQTNTAKILSRNKLSSAFQWHTVFFFFGGGGDLIISYFYALRLAWECLLEKKLIVSSH